MLFEYYFHIHTKQYFQKDQAKPILDQKYVFTFENEFVKINLSFFSWRFYTHFFCLDQVYVRMNDFNMALQ